MTTREQTIAARLREARAALAACGRDGAARELEATSASVRQALAHVMLAGVDRVYAERTYAALYRLGAAICEPEAQAPPLASVMAHTVAGVLPDAEHRSACALGIQAERDRVRALLGERVAGEVEPTAPTPADAWETAEAFAERVYPVRGIGRRSDDDGPRTTLEDAIRARDAKHAEHLRALLGDDAAAGVDLDDVAACWAIASQGCECIGDATVCVPCKAAADLLRHAPKLEAIARADVALRADLREHADRCAK